jgi:signal transduction histidine kinase
MFAGGVMIKSPWRTLLLFLSIVVSALLSGLFMKNTGVLFAAWSLFMAALGLALGIFLSRKPVVTASPAAATASRPDSAEEKEEPEVAREASHDEDDGDEDMQPIPADADRIAKIVNGLDELEKAGVLARALKKEPLELRDCLNTILDAARERVRDRELTLTLECEHDLKLWADPLCLKGIVANLLDNAVKAVKNGGAVTVSAVAEGDHVVLKVRDTGTGISRKALPHIFERFYRGSGSGIGLGLAIVKELVDSCGGKIDVQTKRGEGSTISVRIPRESGAPGERLAINPGGR